MLAWASTDASRELVASWRELETELADHIAAEEEVILPSYAVHAPADAQRIREDHARILALLLPLGVDVELHEVHLARLRLLVEALDAHSISEDAGMYPWAAQHLALVGQRLLFARIGRWIGRA